MTTVGFTILGINFSNYVQQIDIWRESLLGVGRWEAILDPLNAITWIGAFAVGNTVVISIDGVIMMEGYIDDVKPFRDKRGVNTWRWKFSGRDYGFDLAELYETIEYENTAGDDIVQNVLTTAGSEITFASPSGAALMNYRFDRTYLSDGIRDVAKEIGYDFYVQNSKVAGNAILHFFPVSSPFEGSGVILNSIAGSTANNILNPLEIGESIGSNLKNNVEVVAGALRDHLTEFNSADYTPNANTVVTDDLNLFLHGRASIAFTNNTGAGHMEASINLPLLNRSTGDTNYTSIDLSARNEGSYSFKPDFVAAGNISVKIFLTDVNGDRIEFHRRVWPALGPQWHNCTDATDTVRWRRVRFEYGDGVQINGAGSLFQDDVWRYRAPSAGFDWTQVTGFGFHTFDTTVSNLNDRVWIDGLDIPGFEVRALAIDGFSDFIYNTRMISYYKPEIRSQVELDAASLYELNRSKDPVESIPNVLCIGQTGTPYPGQTVSVVITNYVFPATTYRIFSLHHQVVKTSDDSPYPGYTFTTEYNLVKHMIGASEQVVLPERLAFDRNPQKGITRMTRDAIHALQRPERA